MSLVGTQKVINLLGRDKADQLSHMCLLHKPPEDESCLSFRVSETPFIWIWWSDVYLKLSILTSALLLVIMLMLANHVRWPERASANLFLFHCTLTKSRVPNRKTIQMWTIEKKKGMFEDNTWWELPTLSRFRMKWQAQLWLIDIKRMWAQWKDDN